MHAPQLAAVMQRVYKDALQHEKFEIDCVATLQFENAFAAPQPKSLPPLLLEE